MGTQWGHWGTEGPLGYREEKGGHKGGGIGTQRGAWGYRGDIGNTKGGIGDTMGGHWGTEGSLGYRGEKGGDRGGAVGSLTPPRAVPAVLALA